MKKTKAVGKAFLWFLAGAIFSIVSVWLIMASAKFFKGEENFGHIEGFSPELAVFVSIALMAGAGSDFVLSVLDKTSHKWIVGLIVILSVSVVFGLLNTKVEKADNVVINFTYGFCAIALIYCLIVKTAVFHHEMILSNKNKKCSCQHT